MKTLKNIISAIIFGAFSAFSFVLVKEFANKKILNSKKPMKLLTKIPPAQQKFVLDFSNEEESSLRDTEVSKQSSDFNEDIKSYRSDVSRNEDNKQLNSKKLTEYAFNIDYPKSNLPNAASLIYNNMVMVDAESFTKAFNMDSIFNREKGTLTILFQDNSLIFNLFEKSVKFNNEIINCEEHAVSFNDMLFIPLPLTAQILGIKVKRNDKDRILLIYK